MVYYLTTDKNERDYNDLCYIHCNAVANFSHVLGGGEEQRQSNVKMNECSLLSSENGKV